MKKSQSQPEEVVSKEVGIKAVIAKARKQYGSAIFSGSEISKISTIPGILPVDIITGIGGIPRGRITEIFGPQSGGKTTLSLQYLASAQKLGLAAFIDAEHAFDPPYAASLGVDLDSLLVAEPNSAEESLNITTDLLRTHELSIIVIDSVAALTPQKELEGDVGDLKMALQARIMSQALRIMASAAYQSNTALVFINQTRANIGGYGATEVTTGGKALPFYAVLRMKLSNKGQIVNSQQEKIGANIKIYIEKNKLASPYRSVILPMCAGMGFDPHLAIISAGLTWQILTQVKYKGISYKEESLGKSITKAGLFLKENPEMEQTISQEILKVSGSIDMEPEEENEGSDGAN